MTVSIEVEPFTAQLAEEIRPLGQQCWDESTRMKGETCAFHGARDFVIEPDIEQYDILNRNSLLLILTLRDSGVLRGYTIGILYRSLHHRGIIVGGGDSFYIDPDYRSYTAIMVDKFESELKSKGAIIIGWPTHTHGPLYAVLKAKGYVGDDVVMEKKLCAL